MCHAAAGPLRSDCFPTARSTHRRCHGCCVRHMCTCSCRAHADHSITGAVAIANAITTIIAYNICMCRDQRPGPQHHNRSVPEPHTLNPNSKNVNPKPSAAQAVGAHGAAAASTEMTTGSENPHEQSPRMWPSRTRPASAVISAPSSSIAKKFVTRPSSMPSPAP